MNESEGFKRGMLAAADVVEEWSGTGTGNRWLSSELRAAARALRMLAEDDNELDRLMRKGTDA